MAAVLGNGPFTINEWRVDPSLNRVSRGEEIVKIDPQDMKVLELLASKPGEVFSPAEIEQSAWPNVIVTPNSVYQSIAHLRRAFSDDKSNPKYIETIARKGYRCVARVEPPTSPLPLLPDISIGPTERSAAKPRHRFVWGSTIVIALLVGIAATFLVTDRDAKLNGSSNETIEARHALQSVPTSRIARAQMAVGLGDAAIQLRDTSTGLRHYQNAIDELDGAFTGSDPYLAEVLIKRAWVLHALDELDRALQETETAIQVLEKNSVPTNPLFISARSLYAEILTSFGRSGEAEQQAQTSLSLAVALYGDHSIEAAFARGTVARQKLMAGDWQEAEAAARAVLAQYSARITDNSLDMVAQYRTILALTLYQQGRFEDAASEARNALRVLENSVEYGLSASALQALSDALVRKGDFTEADIASRKCLQILNELIAAPWRIARAESTRAEILMHRGQLEDAKTKLLQAASVLKSEKDQYAKLAYAETERRLQLLANISQEHHRQQPDG